jgi:hypothetical protein
MNYLQPTADEVLLAVPPDLIPPDSNDLFVLYAVLVRSVGVETTAEHVHDAWTAWMAMRGLDHPAMQPFEDLDPTTQQEDEPFAAAIRLVAARRLDESSS